MKRRKHKHRIRVADRKQQNAGSKSRRRGVGFERLDERVMLDADGLVITSPSDISIRDGETNITSVTADDPAATFEISGGADSGHFGIDTNSGSLTFNNAPDHNNPTDAGNDNVYNIVVRAVDNFAHTAEQPMAVTVLPPNLAPQMSAGTFAVAENQLAVGIVSATDGNTSDAGGDTLGFSFVNAADADVFDLNSLNGELSFVVPPDFESGDTSFSVDMSGTDALGLSDSATQTIAVTNVVEPVVTSAGNVVFPVGQSAVNSGNWSHPTAGTVSLYATSGTVTQNGDGTWTWAGDAPSGPSAVRFVTIGAIDDAGNVATETFSVSGKNTAPILVFDNSTVTVDEADTATNTGTITDIDGDVVTLSTSIGSIVDQGDGTWEWSFVATDGPLQSQYVGIFATDSNGSSRAMSFQLVVQNVPPTISVGLSTISVDEGNTAVNDGTFADIGNDIVTVTADIGSVTTSPDGTWNWSYAAPDGPATETVTVTATDSDGAQTTETFSLSVLNVAPTVAADVASVTVNEGDTATVAGTMSDQAVPEDSIVISASIGSITQGSGTWQWTYDSTDGPDDSVTVTITADDTDGGISTTTFDLIVANVPPALHVDNAMITVAEGATAANTGTISDVGVDTVSLLASRGGVVDNGDGTWAWTFDTQDGPDDSGAVSITATDSDGAESTVQFTMTVDNTAPVIAVDNAPATVAVTEGGTASITGTYSEPGPSDAVTLATSVGIITDNGDDTWSWSLATTDGADQTQTVTVTISDSEGAQGTATFDLVVNNAAPTIAVSEMNVVADEGNTATNTITVNDPGDDTVQSLSTTIGTVVDNRDGTWAWSYVAPNGPATETVTITAQDSDGASTTFDFMLQVDNVAPVVAADLASVTINEGETAIVTGTMSDQAVPADGIALSSSLDGSGAAITPGSGSWSWSYLAADGDGTPETVTVVAEDSDGGLSQTTFDLIVNNLPAELTVADSLVTLDEGQLATNTGTFSDPGVDAVTLSTSFGTVVDDGNGDWSWSYLTTDGTSESQIVMVTATDSDGAESTISFSLTVNNVAPTITADNSTVTVTEGAIASNSGTVADVGSDTLTLAADRGTVIDNGNGTWNWSLGTVDGPDETGDVTITVTDSDGESQNTTFVLNVGNVAPTMAVDQPLVTVNESETATMTGSHADVGDDVVQLTASLGTISDNADGTWTWTFDSADGPIQSQVVSVTAQDHDGLSSAATLNLVVQNVAPTVAVANAAVVVSEGHTATNLGTYGDLGDDTVVVTVDVGTAVTNGDGTWSWSFDPTDGPEDSQTVTVTATDADSAQTTTTFDLVVNNAPGVLVVDSATVTIGEGATATNSGTVTDAGDDAATLSASIGTVTLLPDGTTWNWSSPTTDGADDSQVVTITSTDDDGTTTIATFDLVVNNLPVVPTVDTANVIASEGATAMNTGTYADPGDDSVTFTASIGVIQDNGDGTWAWSFVTTDGATESQQVTITATDSDGAEATATFQLSVQNVNPTLGIDNATVTVSENALAGNSGTFGDIGDDTVSITTSVGDINLDEQTGTWQWSFQTADGTDDSQTVTVTATDDDGGTVSQQFDLVVNNLAPVVVADNPLITVDEGATAANTGSYVDAGGDPVVITASVGSISSDDQAGTWSWTLTTTDGIDDSQVVTITSTDEDGAASSTTFQLNVNNTAPTLTVASLDLSVSEADTASNSGTFSDAGVDDVTLTASAGVITQDNQAGTWSWVFSSTDGPDESQQVDITATDSDGGQSVVSFQLGVDNVPPTVASDNGAVMVSEGATALNTGTMGDVGDDVVMLSASVGSVTDGGDGTWSWAFASTDGTDQSQVVTITATDDEGAEVTTTFALIVNNVAPTIGADNALVATTEGAIASNSGNFDDVGDDTVTLTSSIGTVSDNGNGTWSWTWTANDGPDDTGAATITATDSDGTSASVTFFVQVENVAPTLSVDSATVTVSEGGVAGASGSLGDAGNDSITIAASVGTAVDNGNGTWNWSYNTSDGPEDSQTVTITVSDSDGVSTSVDFDLVVDNVAPATTIDNDLVTVVEGATANNTGTFGDAGDDTLTITTSIGSITDNRDGTWSWSYDTSDGPDETQAVSITVVDSDTVATVETFQLTVANAAPVLAVDNATVTTTEGSNASNSGTVFDLGQDDITLDASIGTITLNQGTWTWSYDTTDGPDQSETVTITATDNDGAVSEIAFDLDVENVAPINIVDNVALTVDEGSAISNTGSFSDVGVDTVNISSDVGIVTQDNEAGTWSWHWTPNNGPAVQPVTLTATDSDGLASNASFNVTVSNVTPTVAVDNTSVTVSESAVATNTGTVEDPGDDDLAISASLGTVILGPNSTWQWQYAAVDGPDQQTVTVTLSDSDGDSSQVTFDLIVNNVAPVIAADNATVTVNESGIASNTGTVLDVGANDIVTLTTSMGNIVDNGNGTWNWSYVSADGPDDSGSVTVTATDSNGDQTSVQFDLVVNNLAPQVHANQSVTIAIEGQSATNTGTYSDSGVDVVTLSATLGQITDNRDGTWSWSYGTSDGPDESQSVVVTATDSDNAVTTVAFDVTVENAAPSVTADVSPVVTTEGSPATNSGTYADVANDEVTLSASLGTLTDNGDGTWSWTHTPNDGPGDSQSVTITATDSDGEVSTATFPMTVANVAPVVIVDSAAISAEENAEVTNTGTFSDAGNDAVQLSASVGNVMDSGDGTWTWSHTPADGPDALSVIITATDANGGMDSQTFDLTVSNVPPSLIVNNNNVSATQGVVAANSGTFGDTFADEVQLAASVGQIADNGDGTWGWTVDTSNSPAGVSLVDITATDSDGESTSMAFNLTIENAPPVVAVSNAVINTPEGSTASNTGTLKDPGNDAMTITASAGSIVDQGDGTWNWSSATTDGPGQSDTITVTVTDAHGDSSAITFQSVVENVAPTVTTNNSNTTVFEGQTVTNTGSYGDVGLDVVTLAASIGSVVDNGDGNWSWSLDTVDGPTQSQTVTITATDSDQLDSTTAFELVVFNVLPDVAVDNATVLVNEGDTATNSGSFGDPGSDTLTITSSVGEVVDSGDGLWTWTYTPSDGPAESQTVTLTVDDGDGGVISSPFQLAVSNQPPSLEADHAVVNVGEGEEATNTGTFDDPGADVVNIAASLGIVTVNEELGTWAWAHVPSDGAETQTVTLTGTDSDGAQVNTTFTLDVANVDPVVIPDQVEVAVTVGELATTTGTFYDVAADTVSLSASLGIIVGNGAGAWVWTHSIADVPSGSQSVTVFATDEDGGSGTATFDLVLENLPPAISQNSETVSLLEGQTATNGGTFSDSTSENVTLSASIGSVVDNGDGTWSWEFATSNGPEESQAVTITATDDGNLASSTSFNLNVLNQDPAIAVTNSMVAAVVGTTASNDGTWGDFGGDTVSLAASAGSVTLNPDGTWDWQLNDVQVSQDVTITATDSDGGVRSLTFDLSAQLPILSVNGNLATIVGTDLDDDFVVTTGPVTHEVAVSGILFVLDATVVTDVHIGGGFGNDSIHVQGSSANETVSATGNRVTINSAAYNLETYDIDIVTFDGVSGSDVANLGGTSDVDRFEGVLNDVTLTTPDFAYRMVNVSRVNAYGGGGIDEADLRGTAGNEFFASVPTHSYIENPSQGTKNYIKGFEEITVDGLGNTDYLFVLDSADDDQLTKYDSHMEFIAPSRHLTLVNFEVNTFESSTGGNDTGTIQLQGQSDHLLVSTPTETRLSHTAFTLRTVGYGTVQAQVTGSGTNTARIESVAAVETLFASGSQATMPTRGLTLDGFDHVIAEAIPGVSPTLDDEQPFDYLLDVIGDWV